MKTFIHDGNTYCAECHAKENYCEWMDDHWFSHEQWCTRFKAGLRRRLELSGYLQDMWRAFTDPRAPDGPPSGRCSPSEIESLIASLRRKIP